VGESTADPRRLRVRAGLGFVQALRPALYALLVLSALFTFWAGGEIAGRKLPHWSQVVAPTFFAVFLVVFAVYRFALVRAKKYPAAVGLFQVGLGALIWVLLLPSTRQKIAPPGAVDDVAVLLTSPDARVRVPERRKEVRCGADRSARRLRPARPRPGPCLAGAPLRPRPGSRPRLMGRIEDTLRLYFHREAAKAAKVCLVGARPGSVVARARNPKRLRELRGFAVDVVFVDVAFDGRVR